MACGVCDAVDLHTDFACNGTDRTIPHGCGPIDRPQQGVVFSPLSTQSHGSMPRKSPTLHSCSLGATAAREMLNPTWEARAIAPRSCNSPSELSVMAVAPAARATTPRPGVNCGQR